jgi:hypothetical protein
VRSVGYRPGLFTLHPFGMLFHNCNAIQRVYLICEHGFLHREVGGRIALGRLQVFEP